MAGDYERTIAAYHKHGLYPLTSLQIGDIQSYLSSLFLRTVYSEKKLVLFVDNSPWTVESQRSKPVEFWQLMVTQSRTSPFTNQSLKPSVCRMNPENSPEHSVNPATGRSVGETTARRKLFQRDQGYLFKLFQDLFQRPLKSVVSVQELTYQLHGCIAFELEWANIRGINYINELQTDTCVAFETKLLVKRDFHSFRQALSFYGVKPGRAWSGWFRSAEAKKSMLLNAQVENNKDQGCTDASSQKQSAEVTGLWSACSQMLERHQSMDLPFQSPDEAGSCGDSPAVEEDGVIANCCSSADIPPRLYRDMLILFRFCDPILPLELKTIITADQRLLKMLESGLPSWVIFLQSYPLVCKVYKPWMGFLVKSMYVLVSIITVIIGFYDLYKNVPLLKATAARICGPLFEWIEEWEMISRIKYLGTMLFLQNCEKTFRWLIMILRTFRRLSVMLVKPMIEPLEELAEMLLPVWSICSEAVLSFTSLLWMAVSLLVEYLNSVIQLIIWPVIVLLNTVWMLATWLLYPVISAAWGMIVLPIRFIINILNLLVAIACSIVTASREVWEFVNSSGQLLYAGGPSAASLKEAKTSAFSWRILWNDIFSQVFRAVRSIVYGLVAFFTALNRHRLSIYNHSSAFVCQVAHLLKSAHSRVSDAYHHVLEKPLLREGGFEDEDNCTCSERKSLAVKPLSRENCRENTLAGADTCMNSASMALKKAGKYL